MSKLIVSEKTKWRIEKTHTSTRIIDFGPGTQPCQQPETARLIQAENPDDSRDSQSSEIIKRK